MAAREDRDLETITDMLRARARVTEYSCGIDQADFSDNGQLVSSVSYQIAILGEAARRLSDHLKSSNPHVPWKDISGMRNHLIHAYDHVDVTEVWRVAVRDIPILIEQLHAIELDLMP